MNGSLFLFRSCCIVFVAFREDRDLRQTVFQLSLGVSFSIPTIGGQRGGLFLINCASRKELHVFGSCVKNTYNRQKGYEICCNFVRCILVRMNCGDLYHHNLTGGQVAVHECRTFDGESWSKPMIIVDKRRIQYNLLNQGQFIFHKITEPRSYSLRFTYRSMDNITTISLVNLLNCKLYGCK